MKPLTVGGHLNRANSERNPEEMIYEAQQRLSDLRSGFGGAADRIFSRAGIGLGRLGRIWLSAIRIRLLSRWNLFKRLLSLWLQIFDAFRLRVLSALWFSILPLLRAAGVEFSVYQAESDPPFWKFWLQRRTPAVFSQSAIHARKDHSGGPKARLYAPAISPQVSKCSFAQSRFASRNPVKATGFKIYVAK